MARTEHEAFQRDIDYKHSLIQKYEFDLQKQVETVAYLNDDVSILSNLPCGGCFFFLVCRIHSF